MTKWSTLASKAVYNILYTHSDKIGWLIEQFADVNDPYVIERILCICLGVIIRSKDVELNKKVAKIVYDNIFADKEVVSDVLIREYAYLIILKCIDSVGNIEGIELSCIKPPYRSEDISNIEKISYKSDDYGSGFNCILRSLKPDRLPNCRGLYGNFGRYVFESSLNNFKDVNIEDCYYYALWYIRNELGYKDEFFSDYDRRGFHLNYYPGQVINIERIGKKYQWIALRHIIAKISDNHLIRKYDQSDKFGDYEGTWELYDLRDFDSSITMYDVDTSFLPKFEKREVNYYFDEDNSDDQSIGNWINSKGDFLESCMESLVMTDLNGCKWVRLYISEKHSSKRFSLRRRHYTSMKGDRYSWFLGQAFFAKEDDRKLLYDKIKDTNYWGQWFPRENTESGIMLGEYPWSPACANKRKHEWERGYEVDTIANSRQLAEIDVMNATIYARWESEYDTTIDGTNYESIPCIKLMEDLKLSEVRGNGCFFNEQDVLVAFDNSLIDKDHGLIIRFDSLKEFLIKNDFCIFWTLIGENRYHYVDSSDNQKWSEWSGYAILEDDEVISEIYNTTLRENKHR